MLKTCCNVLTEVGILLLIIFPPIFFGAVLPLHTTIIQTVIWGLGLVFLVKSVFKGSVTYIPGPLDLSLILFFLWGIVNLLTTTYGHRTELELYKLLYYAMLYGIVLQYVKTIRRLMGLAFLLVLVGSGETLFGLWQYLRGAKTVLGQATPNIGTVNATYFSHNHFAGFLILIIPVTLGLLIGSRQIEKKGFLALLTGIMGAALVLSLSRGGLLSITIALAGLIICMMVKKVQETGAWVRYILLPLLLIGCIAGFILWMGLSPIAHRSLSDTFFPEKSAFEEEIRFSLWRNALALVKEFPLWGSGLGTFEYVFQRYRPDILAQNQQVYYAHNDYLELLTEMGFPALLIVVWGIIRFYRYGLRTYFRHQDPVLTSLLLGGMTSCTAMFIHSAFDFNLQIPANALLFTIILAMTTATANLLSHHRNHAQSNTIAKTHSLLHDLVFYLTPSRHQIKTLWQLLLLPGIGVLIGLGFSFRNPLADKYYGRAKTLHYTDALLPAISWHAKAIAIDPGNAEYYESLGQLYRDLGNTAPHAEKWYRLSAEAFQQAIRLNPYQAAYYYQLGLVDDAVDDESAAIQAFKTAVAYAPRLAFYHENLGHYLLYLQRTDAVVAVYRQAIVLDVKRMSPILEKCQQYHLSYEFYRQIIPDTADARLRFAEWLAQNNLWQESKHEYRNAIELSGQDQRVYDAMLDACRRRQDYECLREGWRELARQQPENPQMLLNIAESFVKQQQWDEALREYETLVTRFPDNAAISSRIGQIYQQQGRWDDAVRHYQSLIHQSPQNLALYHALSGIYAQGSRWQDAISVYLTALASGLTQPEIPANLGELYEQLGDPKQALAYYEQAIQSGETRFAIYQKVENLSQQANQPQQHVLWDMYVMANAQRPEALFPLAQHYQAQGEWLNAVNLSKEIIANAPTKAEYRIFLADLYTQQNMLFEAIEQWEKLVTLNTGNINYHLRLAALYEQVKDWKNAKTQYRRILKISPEHKQAQQKLAALGG